MSFDVNKTSNKGWLFAVAFALLVVLPAVSAVVVNINELPVFVRPKDLSGNLQPSTGFNYVFNFTTDSGCSNVLLSRSQFITTDKYGVGFVNLDTSPLVGGAVPSYMCEYRAGVLRETHTLNPNIFGEDTGSGSSGTFNATQGPYLYDNGVMVFFNETKLNQTIDARDSDTTYTNGTGLLLSGTTFSLDMLYLNANFVGQTEYPFLDTNSTDDVLSVTAGAGLNGGGSGGALTVNVGGGTGIIVSADNVSVDNLIVPFKNTAETISGAWVFNNDLTINGNLNVIGSTVNLTVQQQIINGSIYPEISGLFDLGSPSQLWNTVYANSFIGALDWSNLTGIPADIDLVASDDITNVSTAGGQLTGTFNALSIVPNSVSASQLNLTDITISDFLNDAGYLTNATLNETDPFFIAANSTLARTGNCPNGFAVQNTTSSTGGVECTPITSTGDGTGINTTVGPYLYDNGSTAFFNETQLNQTIAAAIANTTDDDTAYNDTALINAVNTTSNIQSLGFNTTSELDNYFYPFNTNPAGYLTNATLNETDPIWNAQKTNYYLKTETYNKTEVYNKTEQAGWDQNSSDDFNGSWSALTGVPAGFADGIDNDTTYSAGTGLTLNSSNTFAVNQTYINSIETDPAFTAANSTLARTGTCPSGQFVVNTTTNGVQCLTPPDNDTTYTNGTGLLLTGTTFSIDQTYFNANYASLTAFNSLNSTVVSNTASIASLNSTKLDATDQRYNDTVAISAVDARVTSVNATVATNTANIATQTARIDSLNNTKLNATDQRYNDTALINAVNTTANIQSLGFNTTTQLSTLFTYTAGTGLQLSTNTFSINGTYLNTSIDARATAAAFNLQNITNNGATTTNRIITGGLNSSANITLTTASTCLNGASGGYICFNSTHTWIG